MEAVEYTVFLTIATELQEFPSVIFFVVTSIASKGSTTVACFSGIFFVVLQDMSCEFIFHTPYSTG